MEWMMVVIVVAAMGSLVAMSWRQSRASECWARSAESLFDKALTYRGVNSPEAQCLEALSKTHALTTEQMMSFTMEGRDRLKEKELAATTIKALEMQLSVYQQTLASNGVRRREHSPTPPPQQEPGTVGAFHDEV